MLFATSVTVPVYPLPVTSAPCPPRLHHTLFNHHLRTFTPGSSQRARPANHRDKCCQMLYSARGTLSTSTPPGQTYPPPSPPTAKPSSCSNGSSPAVRGNQGTRPRSSASWTSMTDTRPVCASCVAPAVSPYRVTYLTRPRRPAIPFETLLRMPCPPPALPQRTRNRSGTRSSRRCYCRRHRRR